MAWLGFYTDQSYDTDDSRRKECEIQPLKNFINYN